MKNNEKPDLSLLENADDEALEMMADYSAAGERDKERIYRITEKMYKRKSNMNSSEETTVSGVERYSRPKWYKSAMTAAAVAVLVGALSVGGAMMFNSTKKIVPQTEYEDTTVTETVTETTTEEYTEPTPHPLRELQLHEVYTVGSLQEAEELYTSRMAEYSYDERPRVDVEHYVDMLKNAEDMNNLELKSYICHLMLNSIDYFDTVQGQMTYDDRAIEFKDDLLERKAYQKQLETENYYCDGNYYQFMSRKDGISQYLLEENADRGASDCYSDDNYRRIIIDSNDHGCASYRNSPVIFWSEETAIFPQAIAMSFLWDFNLWHIDSIEEYNGRECALISGVRENGVNNFTMYIDIQTGIMMKLDEDNSHINIEEIAVDMPCDIELPDLSGCKRIKYLMGQNGSDEVPYDMPDYPSNKSGQLYGDIYDDGDFRFIPDLVAVTGDNGVSGYLMKNDWLIAVAGEEVLYYEPAYPMPVFDSDGMTQVDVYSY